MKEKQKRTPVIPLGIIIVDDPLSETDTPENRKKFNFWLEKTFSPRLKAYKVNKELSTIFQERNINKPKTNEDMRTNPPKKTSLRLELETYVYAWNTRLKEAVKTMSMVILLRNAHPAYRASFASQAFEKGLISNEERSEFIIGQIARQHSRTNWFI